MTAPVPEGAEAFAARPAMYTTNIPDPAEVPALLADRDRLRAFVMGGLRLFRRANSRRWDAATRAEDPSFGQKSNTSAREEWLAHYAWCHSYTPTLLLVIDQGLLDGTADAQEKATRSE